MAARALPSEPVILATDPAAPPENIYTFCIHVYSKNLLIMTSVITRNVSIGHRCPYFSIFVTKVLFLKTDKGKSKCPIKWGHNKVLVSTLQYYFSVLFQNTRALE